MATRNHLSLAKSYGAAAFAGIRFVPGASTAAIVTQESWGIKSIVRDGTGLYTIVLLGKPKGFIAVTEGQEDDTTTYHFTRVETRSDVTSSVQISHKSVAFASVATGPAASDTIDAITVLFYTRGE